MSRLDHTLEPSPVRRIEVITGSEMADTLAKIVNGHLNSEIDELLPWAYAAPQQLKHVA